jgi:hypothetical protein
MGVNYSLVGNGHKTDVCVCVCVCVCILLMKYIMKKIGHRLNLCAIGLLGSDFRISCMSQCKIIQQLLCYHGDNVVCVFHSPGGALNTIIYL